MRVNELATQLGVSADTVRFYTRNNILQPAKDGNNGYRNYSKADADRLGFVLSARQLGFSVSDIQQILDHADHQQSPCPTVRRLIEQRLEETEQRIAEMTRLSKRMQRALNDWTDKPDKVPTGHSVCHLIEEFSTKQ